jgi:PI-3-kinase-related kinase SMG-1
MPVNRLGPKVSHLTGLGPALTRLLADLDSLTAAAANTAAGIQSEHAHNEDDSVASGGENKRQQQGALGEAGLPTAGAAVMAGGPSTATGGWRWGASSGGPSSARHKRADEARRRAFAVAALRRCIAKLEGRDGDPRGAAEDGGGAVSASGPTSASAASKCPQPQQLQQQTVTQQGDLLIRQASSVDRLSRMFEGWMPWL